MLETDRKFSHVSNFPGYMHVVKGILSAQGKAGERVLDIPAGSGKFSDSLRLAGYEVTSGDIDQDRPDFVFANMEQPLPFADNSFDWVICMEGIEHVINPSLLVQELCRVTRPGGKVIITTPNIHSMYCRLMFLFTGVLYMFEPETTRHPGAEMMDRGHISPMAYPSLNYLMEENGCTPLLVTGDKFKRKIYLPFYLLPMLVSKFMIRRYQKRNPKVSAYGFMSNNHLLLSRSLIGVWQKA